MNCGTDASTDCLAPFCRTCDRCLIHCRCDRRRLVEPETSRESARRHVETIGYVYWKPSNGKLIAGE